MGNDITQEWSRSIQDIYRKMMKIDINVFNTHVNGVDINSNYHQWMENWMYMNLIESQISHHLIVGFSNSLSVAMLESMAGIIEDICNEDITDASKEIVNMIGGSYKSCCNQVNHRINEMTIPTTIQTEDVTLVRLASSHFASLELSCNKGMGMVTIYRSRREVHESVDS